MTYRYTNMNQHDALYKVARKYLGGIEALACRMGILVATLYKKLRPAVETHHVTFEEATEIMEHLDEAHVPDAFAPLHAMCWRLGHVAFQMPKAEQDPDDLLKQLVDVMSADGVLATLLNKALATDGDINNQEFDEIDQALMESIMALVVLRQKVVQKHEADKQAARSIGA